MADVSAQMIKDLRERTGAGMADCKKALTECAADMEKAIEYLRTQLGADLASAHLVIDGTRTVLAQTDNQIVDLLRAGQGVLNVVALGPVVDDLATQLHRFAPDATAPTATASRSNAAAR